MKYLQITFKVSPDTELVRELLVAMASEAGCDSFSEEEDMVKGYCLEDVFDEQTLKEGISNFILPDTKIEYKVEKAEDKNWNEEWEKAGFAPIIINERCVICSVKEENPQALIENAEGNSPLIIRIDPKQAFWFGHPRNHTNDCCTIVGYGFKREKRIGLWLWHGNLVDSSRQMRCKKGLRIRH